MELYECCVNEVFSGYTLGDLQILQRYKSLYIELTNTTNRCKFYSLLVPGTISLLYN